MSLSRPATFPLLKLPFLCIEPVIKSWDIFDIIFFALTSKRTRQIVKHLKIPLNGIKIIVREENSIELDRRRWSITRTICDSFFEKYANSRTDILVLRNNGISLYTKRTNDGLMSYTYGSEVNALKLAMEFLNEVFKCSVETVNINGDNFPESRDIGVESTVNLFFDNTYSYAQSQQLSSLLENLEVTGTCDFWMRNTEMDFYVDPKLFKCRKLVFGARSADWVTREILLQFEVAQLKFYDCPFSVEDILSFVTNWFHSDNKKLEYLFIYTQSTQFSLEKFQTEDLNPLPFSGKTRIPPIETYTMFDFSVGLEIVRNDGSVATIYFNSGVFLFYVWHDQ
ncbi:unnamed protein product [Caenorhabditis brenneri]